MNPHAEVWINGKDNDGNYKSEYLTGKASGCGYDKESASVASAFDGSTAITKMLFDFMDTGEQFTYGVSTGYSFPHFSGGVGMSCFVNVFKQLGFTAVSHHGKTYDGYTFERTAKKDID